MQTCTCGRARLKLLNWSRSRMAVTCSTRGVSARSAAAEKVDQTGQPAAALELKAITLDEDPAPAPPPGDQNPIPDNIQEFPAPPDTVLKAFEVPDGMTIHQAGRLLEAQLADALAPTGAALIRNLPVSSTAEVAQMISAAQEVDATRPKSSWTKMPYVPFGAPRDENDGVMMATNIPENLVLKCHNESSYNPLVPRRIGLLCLEPAAEGGESLITTNESLNDAGPPDLFDFIREHGGLEYKRVFHDKCVDAERGPASMSWQDRCGLGDDGTPEQAEEYWKANGFTDEHLKWGPDRTLIITNIATGFTPAIGARVDAPFPGGYSAFWDSAKLAASLGLKDSNSNVPERQEWFNILNIMPAGYIKCADGSEIPAEMIERHEAKAWFKTFAVKMQAGDLLMLDNLRVQHGRLPYTNKGDGKRTVVTLLYE